MNRVNLDVLRSMLGAVVDSAEKLLVLINSCDSGAFLGSTAFGPSPFGPGEKGAHAILASRSNQQSLQLDALGPGSVFFEEVLTALGGAADKSPADGVVTYHELDTYLRAEIPHATRGTQSPVEGDLSWPRHSVGEFFFLNRNRQISLGNAPPWNPKDAVAFGASAEDVVKRAIEAHLAGRSRHAVELLTEAAAKGNVDSMVYLGFFYRDGLGVARDYRQAGLWFEKAVAAGSTTAMYELGVQFERGQGVTQNYKQARDWFEKAAEGGSPQAMTSLGSLYSFGHGATQDYGNARRWYEMGAAAGDASAMYALGSLYDDGYGVTQDYKQALQWYEKGAAAGSSAAMTALGTLYSYGRGVPQDYRQAGLWYFKAVERDGNAVASFSLGFMWENGLGVKPDLKEARQWYERAAVAGYQQAIERLKQLGE